MSSSCRVLRTQKPQKHKRGGRAFASSKSLNSFSTFWVRVKTGFRWMLKILLVAAGAYGVYFCYHFFTTSPRFAVSQVTLTGNQTLQEKEILERLCPVTGSNIFLLNLESLSTQLAEHPLGANRFCQKSVSSGNSGPCGRKKTLCPNQAG